MKVSITRMSVSAGDDLDPPHLKEIDMPDDSTVEEIITSIVASGYLPKICGGKATWSVSSKKLLAVVAQQWKQPKMLEFPPFKFELDELDYADNNLKIHFNYHAQKKPDMVFVVLSEVDQ